MNPDGTQPQTLFSGNQSQSGQTLFSGAQGISSQSNQPSTQLDPAVVNLAKAIRQTESGGNFSATGKSGEYGAYQFTDPTWNAWAKKYGITTPLDQATPEQQNAVAYNQIKAWKDQGYNVAQIASMWNAGQGEPNAYTGKFSDGSPSSGTNKFGAKYNVADYAYSVAKAYNTLKGGGQVSADPNNPSSVANTQNGQSTQTSQPSSLGGDVLGGLKWLGNTLFPIGGDLYNDFTGKSNKGIIPQLADAGLSALSVAAPIASVFGGPEIEAGDIGLDTAVAGSEAAAKSTLLPTLLKSAGYGAAAGGLGAIGQGGGPTQALQGAGLGAATGGVLGLGGHLLSSFLDNVPERITQGLFKSGGAKLSSEAAQYGIENKSIGSFSNMLNDTLSSIEDKGGQINDILSSPKYGETGYGQFRTPVGDGSAALDKTLAKFPNAGFQSTSDIASAAKNVVPLQSDLVDKLVSGDATLAEKNTLRSALDNAIYPKVGDLPKLTADKQVSHILANYLRQEVQTTAPETQPLFSDLSKEMQWKKVLSRLNAKGSTPVTMKSLLGAASGLGLTGGNPLGALAGYGGEKLLESPQANFLLAKLLSGAGNAVSSPITQGVGMAGTGLIANLLGRSTSPGVSQ